MLIEFTAYIFAAILLGYFFGCINGSEIIGKWKHVDIKNSGVKNPGASNTVIVLGWKYGVIVALIDISKAAIPIIIAGSVLNAAGLDPGIILILKYIIGTSVIIGHNFPFQMKFLGGKGTASAVGMILAVNWKLGLLSILFFVLIAVISNYIVIGVFSMYLSFLSTTYFFDAGKTATFIVLGLLLLSVYQHRENIYRIINKTEPKLMSVVSRR